MEDLTGSTRLKRRVRIFTWHIHGSYLYYLSQANCEFLIPLGKGRSGGYSPLDKTSFDWGKNVREVDIESIRHLEFDCILFQSRKGYLEDQYQILSEKQRSLPKIYLEHDPPREHPTDTKHFVRDPKVLLVHVTHFNHLMWDSGPTPTKVISHGISVPDEVSYTGELDRGIVVINNLKKRGRRLGLDIFEKAREEIPLDLIGAGSKELGGLGEIPHCQLYTFISRYRFFFQPIRYTSLGLSLIEAMMVGLPIVSLATTEIPTVIENDISGFIHTDINVLIEKMRYLLDHQGEAAVVGRNARIKAKIDFSLRRFTRDWQETFEALIKASKGGLGTESFKQMTGEKEAS